MAISAKKHLDHLGQRHRKVQLHRRNVFWKPKAQRSKQQLHHQLSFERKCERLHFARTDHKNQQCHQQRIVWSEQSSDFWLVETGSGVWTRRSVLWCFHIPDWRIFRMDRQCDSVSSSTHMEPIWKWAWGFYVVERVLWKSTELALWSVTWYKVTVAFVIWKQFYCSSKRKLINRRMVINNDGVDTIAIWRYLKRYEKCRNERACMDILYQIFWSIQIPDCNGCNQICYWEKRKTSWTTPSIIIRFNKCSSILQTLVNSRSNDWSTKISRIKQLLK